MEKRFIVLFVAFGLAPNVIMPLLSGEALPRAYGICMIGHARDLANFILSELSGHYFSHYHLLLTTVGVIIGASIAARRSGGLRKRELKLGERKARPFIYGFGAAISALLLGACPIRVYAQLGWLSPLALIGLLFLTLGAFTALEGKM